MRKLLFALLVISSILIISSCMVPKTEIERLVPPNDATEDVIFAAQSSNGVYSANLIVGADTVIGRIDYWVDNENKLLYIDFHSTENGWMLTETRVAAGLSLSDLPRNPESGRLDPKLYPNANFHNPPVSLSSFVIPLDFVGEGTTKVYFSAYAEALRNKDKYFSQIGITAPCIYFAIVYTEPVVELRPILKVDVDGEIDLSRVTKYDWELSKEASPSVISNLRQEDSATVEYTLTATRLAPEISDTYTLTGIATVTNEGSLQADQVGLKAILLGKNGGSWVEVESKTLIETSSNTTLAASDLVGIGKPFTFEFNPGDYSEVRILAEATDNWPEIVDDFEDHLIPISPSSSSQTFVDESASVIDMPRNLVEFENLGFSVDHTGTWPWSVSPWVLNNTSGGTKKYSIVITNVNAPLGSYTLTNDATLTENDTLTKREASARVLVSTPEPQEDILTLEATVTGSFKWDREIEYDWEIEKSVSPETIYLGIGEDADVTYTVNATRTLTDNATDTFSYKGEVEVGNSLTSNLTASGVSLTISLLESSDGGTFAVAQTSTQPIVDLAPGDKVAKSFDFSSYSFVSGYYYGVKAEVVSGVVLKTNTGALTGPISPNLTEYDMTATVNDGYMVPVGFDVTPDSDYVWPWLLSETPAATTYTFNIVNKEKETGEFKVPNTVTLAEDDTKQERSDDATVTINVPEDKDLEIANEHDMEWDQTKNYSWEIEKSAIPESIELNEGEDGTFAYTLLATRTLEETNIATLTGLATVTNTGNVALTSINVEIVLKDKDGVEIGTFTDTIATLAIGAEKGFPYSFTFDPTKAPFKVFAKATGGASDDLETDQPLPLPNVTEYDKDAFVKDNFASFTWAGIVIEGNIYCDWFNIIESANWDSLANSWSVSYSVTATNTGAAPDEYPLDNTVDIYGEDSEEILDRDEESVLIIVPPDNDLDIENEHDMEWDQTKQYSWIIDKIVTPQSVTLGTGEFGTFNYTLVATRSVEETNIATLTGVATISNTGNTTLSNILVVITLKDNNGATIKSYNTTITSLTPGSEQTIPYSLEGFGPSSYVTPFKVVVNATDSASDSLETTQTVPSPKVTEIDKNAYVEDTFDPFSVAGLTLSGNIFREWSVTTASWAKSYSVTATNTSAAPGQYSLHNTVEIFGEDTDNLYDSDEETVTIKVDENNDLDIENEHDMEWDQTKQYSWIIDKSVTPQSVTLGTGEFGTFNYTLVATRSVEETNIATLTGVATISNTGNTTLTGIAVSIVLKDANGSTIKSFNTIINSLAPGNKQTIQYSFKGFNPGAFVAPFKVVVNAIDGASDSLETTQTVPSPDVTEIDENAYVEDAFDPFSVAGLTLLGNEHREWSVTTASWTQSYSVTVANTDAAPGKYYLHNTAVIYGEDTDHPYDSDEETITIEVPETVELEAQLEADFSWDRLRSYSWQLEKEVNPDSITYDVDEFEKEIDYTVTATRTLESDESTYSYRGSVTVTNNGLSEAKNVKLHIELQYYNGTSWITIETLPQVSLGNLAAGLSTVHGFGPSAFTPVDVSAEHRIVVVASADAPANIADDSYSSMLQITNSTSTNANATLDDEFTYIPEGFQIVGTDPDPLPFPMELTNSAVVQFSITLRKFSYDGESGLSYVMGDDAYITATVTGYLEGTYPGWCTEVNVSGIEGPYTIVDVYEGGAPSTQMAKINYILNRFRDGDYPGVDYRHIQIAIWTIMEGSLNWSSWRTMFNPDVPDGDKSLVETIIDTADEDFLPGCGDVVLISALSSNKQNLILEAVLSCEVQEFTLENTATLVTETDELWDDAVVEIRLTPTDPQVWKEETAWGGDYPGAGATWWYYFDTQGPSTQDIYAGQKKVEGASVTYKNGKLTIVLGPDMRLQSVSESVKIQGYAEGDLPTSGPNPGHFTAKGTDLEVSVSPARYYAIHLDVEVKQ